MVAGDDNDLFASTLEAFLDRLPPVAADEQTALAS
jgi:hypothetical protein